MLLTLSIMVAFLSQNPQTMPADDASIPATAPATQPANPLSKYYNLTRTMFMKDADGRIVMATPEVERVLSDIRNAALKEKSRVDQQIPPAEADVKKAMAAEDNAKAQARADLAKAREHVAKEDHTDYGANRRRVRAEKRHNAYQEGLARDAADAAKHDEVNAKKAVDDARNASARLQALRSKSAQLATTTSPNYRNIPPRFLWEGLSPADQALMGRVGISIPEFKTVITRAGMNEADFVKMAQEMDKWADNDRLTHELRAFFKKSLTSTRPS